MTDHDALTGGTKPPLADIPFGMVRLEFISGTRRGELLDLPCPGVHSVGCEDTCAVQFDRAYEPYVSGLHAELRLTPMRGDLADLQSSNGTSLNGQELIDSQRLYCGDMVELGFGGPRFRFYARGEGYVRQLQGQGTVILKRRRSSRRGRKDEAEATTSLRRTVAAYVLVCLAMGVVAYSFFKNQQRASQTTGAVTALREALSATQETMKTSAPDAIGRSLAERYGPAVFLVAMRVVQDGFETRKGVVPVGYLHPGGTAWAFDKAGLLVSNAHVVSAALKLLKRHEPYVELVAVQNGTGAVYPIKHTRIHPAAIDQDDPVYRVSDVAILELGQPLDAVIPMEGRRAVQALSSGVPVFTIGFPIEHFGAMQQFYSYDTPERVVATLRHGWIQRVTAADGRRGPLPEQRLVHVGVAATGGQSGSPVFTQDGKVVAILNAIAQYSRGGKGVMPHPGMFTYAVRVDVLWDLLKLKTSESDLPAKEPSETIAAPSSPLSPE